MSYVSVGLLATLWCVFAASSWSKARSRPALRAFADSLRPLPLLAARLVDPVAVLVTIAELVLVLGITWSVLAMAAGWPAARPGGILVLVLALLLLAVLTTGVILAVRRDIGARCACFGATQQPLSWRHVVRNALLLAVTAAALVTVAAAQTHPLPVAGVLISVAAGSVGALILVRLDDLVELFLPTPSAPLARPARRRP
jgi:hypothetical protein